MASWLRRTSFLRNNSCFCEELPVSFPEVAVGGSVQEAVDAGAHMSQEKRVEISNRTACVEKVQENDYRVGQPEGNVRDEDDGECAREAKRHSRTSSN